MLSEETKSDEHWSTLSLGARMGTWVAGGFMGIGLGFKSTGWLYGWDHPLAIDVSWWFITSPLWCAGPIFAAAALGNEIERRKEPSS